LFDPYLYLNDTRAIKECLMQGIGVAQLHDYIVEKEIRTGKLVEILGKHTEQSKTIPIHISYPPAKPLHAKIRCFIDFYKTTKFKF